MSRWSIRLFLPQNFLFLQKRGKLLDANHHKQSQKALNKRTLPYGIRDTKDAKTLAELLDPDEKKLLFDTLRKSMADQYNEHKRLGQAEIHHDDCKALWYICFVPNLICGILHSVNLIFLVESLQHFFGHAGLSIMGAAGLANVVANVTLLNFDKQIEIFLEKFNIKRPVLSAEQMYTKVYRHLTMFAKLFGMLVGSLVGLTPLLFYIHPVDLRVMKIKEAYKKAPLVRNQEEEAALHFAEAETDQLLRNREKLDQISPEEIAIAIKYT